MISKPKRVLILSSNFPRWVGDSTTPFILHLAQDLIQFGWDVHVLAPFFPGAQKKEIINGVVVVRFSYLWPDSIQTLCYQGGALINLRKNKFNIFKIPFFVLFELFAVTKMVMSDSYLLINSHWLVPQGFVASVVSMLLRIPHVATVHGGDVFILKGSFIDKFKRFSLKFSNAVTVNSSATESQVKKLGVHVNIIDKIPMGVSFDHSPNHDVVKELREMHKRDGILIAFVGRVIEEKGIFDYISAIHIMIEKGVNVRGIVVGDGQDAVSCRKLVKKLGLSNYISFTGWVGSEDLINYLNVADFLVGPTKIPEAQGLVFIEAMAYGSVVIGTNVGGIPELIEPSVTGFLVDVGRPDQIADTVLRIHGNEKLLMEIKKNAFNFANKNFSRRSVAMRFSELFDLVST